MTAAGATATGAEKSPAKPWPRFDGADPALIEAWRTGASTASGCTACNRCVAVMYGPAGTHCPVAGNALDPALKDIFAGEGIANAA